MRRLLCQDPTYLKIIVAWSTDIEESDNVDFRGLLKRRDSRSSSSPRQVPTGCADCRRT